MSFLVDRLKELVKYTGLQVAPAELEEMIQAHPGVQDAGDAGDLMAYVAARVAPHKKIRAVRFVDRIPKSPTGKILRRVLRETALA